MPKKYTRKTINTYEKLWLVVTHDIVIDHWSFLYFIVVITYKLDNITYLKLKIVLFLLLFRNLPANVPIHILNLLPLSTPKNTLYIDDLGV